MHTKDSTPEKSAELLEQAESAFGFLPNLLGVLAESPATLNAYLTLGKIFDEPVDDSRLEALRQFTTTVVEKRGWTSEKDIDSFEQAGFSRAQVREVILGIGFKTLSNYVNHIAEMPLDQQFAERKWSAPAAEIREVGPGRDGIPALDRPRFIAGKSATYLLPDDRVPGLRLGGIARAYPVKILNYHEIVNDRFGMQPVAVTYCPLCGSGMAFSAEAGDRVLEFGVSGLLFNSDVLLFDRQTESLWSQLQREAISGKMKGTKLEPLPVSHTTWRDWLGRYPQTTVLSDRTGYSRTYNVDPYPAY
jgi:hypothetical protein